MTTVVNKKHKVPFDVSIDRGTPFGNPFDHRRLGITRSECISRYKVYFYDRLRRDKNFKEMVLRLKDQRIACWCKPLACHGDVIAEYLDTML